MMDFVKNTVCSPPFAKFLNTFLQSDIYKLVETYGNNYQSEKLKGLAITTLLHWFCQHGADLLTYRSRFSYPHQDSMLLLQT